jgi:hypothetical protein
MPCILVFLLSIYTSAAEGVTGGRSLSFVIDKVKVLGSKGEGTTRCNPGRLVLDPTKMTGDGMDGCNGFSLKLEKVNDQTFRVKDRNQTLEACPNVCPGVAYYCEIELDKNSDHASVKIGQIVNRKLDCTKIVSELPLARQSK